MAAGLPPEAAFPFELAFEELFINIASYGSTDPDRPPQVSIELESRDGWVQATLLDDGVLYDPLLRDAPDVNAALDDRPVGGLGVFLVKELMDEVEYSALDGRNLIRILKRLQ